MDKASALQAAADDVRFEQWFGPWLEARPAMRPRGFFGEVDIRAAFDAGRADQHQQVLDDILARTAALEELLRGTPRKD